MSEHHSTGSHEEHVHLPAPTHWPIIMALGVALGFTGIVTNLGLTILGVVLALAGAIGWFRQVLPREHVENIETTVEDVLVTTTRTEVERIVVPSEDRAHLPIETYPILSGLKGGLAGAIAMVPPALIYGLLAQHSIWYPINLLGGAGVANWRNPSTADIASFHLSGLIVAGIIHIITSLLVGLLYGAMLPMLPKRPILLGGLVAPVLWTGLVHATMGVINPELDARIQWGWFLVSQITFGVVAGWVVAHSQKIYTKQSMPILMRLGFEGSGLHHEDHDQAGEDRK
ncbi:hypothetical protein [Silvibacterium dinghuense]|uniref:Cytochrome c oxidase polypeptide IV n=1 Tax=Silvibacterium dinghuense TaxID=1560006 RepID=A0A4Q1S9W8_9BACT|nr:hypothetical protein [Silvibacterium dinghuense]RXS93838.1 hypothetical protein ESZ00_17515 [Silvibacterium dinghuense]GGH08123.1 hypothetical protein GCM10011586_25500 [Silvibacterium dinghuense]